MSANSTYIPRRLDDQWKVGLWDMDVALPWILTFGFVYTTLGGFPGIVIGGAVATFVGRSAAKLKADKHPAFVMHWAYWNLPEFVVKFHCTPPSHHRRMIG
jgi:conjugal transfer pilus assembly protein TraL